MREVRLGNGLSIYIELCICCEALEDKIYISNISVPWCVAQAL